MNTVSFAKSEKRRAKLLTWQCAFSGRYQIEVYTSVDDLSEEWDLFAKKIQPQYCKNILGIAEKSGLTDFSYYYVIVKEQQTIVALFYFQSLLIRKEYYPNFSDLSFAAKNLYCIISAHNYNLLVNGHIFNTDISGVVVKKEWSNGKDLAKIFDRVIAKVKRISDSSILIIKDAHPLIHSELLQIKNKYKLMPDDVLMEMKIPASWHHIDDYIADLSKKYAVRAKKIEESSSHFIIEELNESEIIQHHVILQKLYLNVISKSSFKMGVLNMNYFAQLKAAMKKDFTFKIWKLNDEIVGFTSYVSVENHMEIYYIGIDYKINKTHHLYQCMLQMGIKDAILSKKPILKMGRTAYEAKAIAGAKPLVKSNFFQISNPILKIGYKYSADYFIAENNTNWQVRNPFKESN